MTTGEQERVLSLRAMDEEDFSVISAFLQDGLARLRDMIYLQEDQQFIVLVDRLVREGRLVDKSEHVEKNRVQTGLCFEGVMSVRVRGVAQEDRNTLLQFITVAYIPGEISLIFDQEAVIRLRGDNLVCLFRDLDVSFSIGGDSV